MIPVIVHGAEGRMGRLVAELVAATDDLELAALVSEPGRGRPAGEFHPTLPLIPQDRMAESIPSGGVIVDFSLAAALDGVLAAAAATGSRLVCGTTGHDKAQLEAVAAHSRDHAVVMAANFSVGIPVMKMLLDRLAELLPGGFMAEQVETHHRQKKDRPSGTAAQLSAAWTARRGGEPAPTHSIRVGGVVGEHRWIFSDDEETIELTHRAHSRQAFLRGLIPAIRFVADRSSGLFGMEDVLAGGRA